MSLGSCTTTRTSLNDIPLRNNLRASNGACTFTRASSAWYEDDTGTVQVALTNIPRISPTKGLLIEEARLNVQINNDAMNLWTRPFGVTGSANTTDTLDPLGTNTAEKITEDDTLLAHGMDAGAMTTVSGSTYELSCYVKKGTRDWFRFNAAGGTAGNCWFNITTLAAGATPTTGITSVTARAVQNGWVRISAIFDNDAFFVGTSKFFGVYHATGDNVTNFAGTVNDYFYAWGFQAEAGSFATSPILTAGTAVTRAAENDTKVSTTGWSINSGRVMFDYIPIWSGVSGDNRFLVDSRWPGGARGFIIFMDPQASAELNVVSGNAGGSTQIASAVLVWTIGVTYRIEYAWGRGNMYLWRTAAGVKTLVASNLTGTAQMPDTFNPTAGICTSAAGGDPRIANGSISNLRVSRI